MDKERQFYCHWDVCDKTLHDFGFVCQENGNLYCDEYCCARALQDETPKEIVTWH